MKRKTALIEVDQNNEIVNIDTMYAKLGFESLDYEIKTMSVMDFYNLKINSVTKKELVNSDVVFGRVNFTKLVLHNLGLQIPTWDDYPGLDSLSHHKLYKRKIWKCKLNRIQDYLYNSLDHLPIVFVKPVKPKEFHAGFVVISDNDKQYISNHIKKDNNLYSISEFKSLNLQSLDNDWELPDAYVSEVVKFESEYRFYINKNRIVGFNYYRGDITKLVAKDTLDFVKFIIEKFYVLNKPNNCGIPETYTIDVGMVQDNDGYLYPVLVETNDFWAIGNYGLDETLFAECIIDRWNQITGKDRE